MIFVINPNGEFSKQMKWLFQKQCIYIHTYFGSVNIILVWNTDIMYYQNLRALWCTPSAPKESSRLTYEARGAKASPQVAWMGSFPLL